MQIHVKHLIPPQLLADLMVSAIECNPMTRAWCGQIFPISGKQVKGPWYANPEFYQDEFQIDVYEIIDERTPDVLKKHICTRQKFVEGFQLIAQKYPRIFAEIITEEYDANTADSFLQLVVLGELVYG